MTPSTSVVLVPTYQHLERETEEMLRQVERRGFHVERRFGMSAIDQARAHMATWALQRGFETIFWVDSDIHFQLSDFLRLAEHKEEFCCVPYRIKQAGGMLAIKGEADSDTRGTVEIEAAGFGFMKTSRAIYVRMGQELPVCIQDANRRNMLIPFFQPRWWKQPDGRDVYYGEDFSFCLHARELGFKLYADFDIQIGHIGRWAYRVREEP